MASHIERGESLHIPFRDGLSISDSQNKPRMYKTKRMFEKAFPKHYLGTDGVELVEYAEVQHGRWIEVDRKTWRTGEGYKIDTTVEEKCSNCGRYIERYETVQQENYCPNCGARMDEEE